MMMMMMMMIMPGFIYFPGEQILILWFVFLVFFRSSLTSLVSVELRENALRALPPSFENLRNLERLDLGDNELTDLPSFIGQLTKLNELWLDHNLLFRLPRVSLQK